MLTAEDITMRALRTEHARLVKAAAKATAEADEYMISGSDSLAIHQDLVAIVNSAFSPKNTRKLEELEKRQARIDRIRKKGLLALLDRQHQAEWERDLAALAIGDLGFRLSRRRHP